MSMSIYVFGAAESPAYPPMKRPGSRYLTNDVRNSILQVKKPRFMTLIMYGIYSNIH